VLPPERRSEFHLAHTLATDTNDLDLVLPLLRLMSQRLGHRLRQRRLTARRLCLELTYADYTTTVRRSPLRTAMLDTELWEVAQRAFALAASKRLAIRSVALTVDQLGVPEEQLELWTEERSLPALQHAVDHIHSRYGSGALTLGRAFPPRTRPQHHQATTILPNVALPSRTRCASAS
jgi:hypothetical protein